MPGWPRPAPGAGSVATSEASEAERRAIIAETRYREQQLGANEIAQCLYISKVNPTKYLCHRKVVIHAHCKPTANNLPV